MVNTNGLILRLQKYNFFFYNDKNLQKNKSFDTKSTTKEKCVTDFPIFAEK